MRVIHVQSIIMPHKILVSPIINIWKYLLYSKSPCPIYARCLAHPPWTLNSLQVMHYWRNWRSRSKDRRRSTPRFVWSSRIPRSSRHARHRQNVGDNAFLNPLIVFCYFPCLNLLRNHYIYGDWECILKKRGDNRKGSRGSTYSIRRVYWRIISLKLCFQQWTGDKLKAERLYHSVS